MDQARIFIAIGISFAIFFLWSMFFAPPPPEIPTQTAENEAAVARAPNGAVKQESGQTEEAAKPPEAVVRESAAPARQIVVDTPLFRMTLSERGGAVTSMVLKEFREALDPKSALKEMIHTDGGAGTVLTALSGQGFQGLEQSVFTTTAKDDSITIERGPGEVHFQHRSANGFIIEKTYTFKPDTYLVGLSVDIYNGTDLMYQGKLGLGLQNRAPDDARAIGFEGPSGLVGNKLQQVKIKKISEQNTIEGLIQWVALEGRYFMTSIIPESGQDGQMLLALNGKIIKNQVAINTGDIGPKQRKGFEYQLFMGPKSLSLLKSYNCNLDRAINFGWFDFLAKPCLWFMNFIYGFIPNYGIAIIILTIISRALFWPLAKKSYKSMGGMRKIQPLMQEIREKYKGDKTRMNQEMMALYKTYKINPMGGCLPMLIQMPVFFALYRMLYQAVELRHAPFMGWINDLSAPDRLFEFGIKIPFMDPPYGIPVLTIIMGASMLLQQKMTPTPGDPAQAKMMMLMPVVFTFIFINFSSGLVLYWLVSNILSMAQQYYTQKQMG
jgi:YidC/Oxa1 family membrane protein insertase